MRNKAFGFFWCLQLLYNRKLLWQRKELLWQRILSEYITEDDMVFDHPAQGMASVSRLEYSGPHSKIHEEHFKEIRRMNVERLKSDRK